jgi:putative toxin-antitoxin system antitoxin component (TIGR02293 family)
MSKTIKNNLKKAAARANGKAGAFAENIKEPVIQYKFRTEAPAHTRAGKMQLSYWLGMPPGQAKRVASEFDIIRLGTAGVTKNAINTLASFIGISRKYITEYIFDVSVKTLERKSNRAKLDKKTSSHAVEIARILQHGYEVFRDEEKLKRWLNKENRALNNLKPVELFDTLSGLSMVNDVLGRVEEGVYS